MAGTKDEGQAAEGATAGKKKMIIIAAAAAVLLAGGGAGAGMVLTKDASAATTAEEEHLVPGDVTALDAVSLNLADGRYLRIGIALQGVQAEDAGGHGGSSGPDGSKALDLLITKFSGLTMAELSDPAARERHKLELQEQIVAAYAEEAEDGTHHKTVMGIYFTQFVMQ